jgi:hypothetical protein
MWDNIGNKLAFLSAMLDGRKIRLFFMSPLGPKKVKRFGSKFWRLLTDGK